MKMGKVLDKTTVDKLIDICVGEDNRACISDAENLILSDLSKDIDLNITFSSPMFKTEK